MDLWLGFWKNGRSLFGELLMKTNLQDTYGPETICFGCGPANKDGLQIKSFVQDNGTVTCEWMPSLEHQAFPGVLNGGIIGTLLDCHMNWTAAWKIMTIRNDDKPPVTVTADFHVYLKRPTPMDVPVHITAKVVEATEKRATIEATLISSDTICATGTGTFVAVPPDHPAQRAFQAKK